MGNADRLIRMIRSRSYNPDKIALGIMAICHEFFYERNWGLEPDCSQWVQEANFDHKLFSMRCDAILYCTTGDPKASWHYIQPLNTNERLGLLEELLDYYLYTNYMFRKEDRDVSYKDMLDMDEWKEDPEGFLWTWNEYFGEETNFTSREEIIYHLCTSENVMEAGREYVELDAEWMDGVMYSERLEFLKKHDQFRSTIVHPGYHPNSYG